MEEYIQALEGKGRLLRTSWPSYVRCRSLARDRILKDVEEADGTYTKCVDKIMGRVSDKLHRRHGITTLRRSIRRRSIGASGKMMIRRYYKGGSILGRAGERPWESDNRRTLVRCHG